MLSAFLVSREQPQLLEETVFQNLLFSQACGEIPCKATPLNLVIFTKGTAEDWVNKHMHTFKKSPVHLLRPHSPDWVEAEVTLCIFISFQFAASTTMGYDI